MLKRIFTLSVIILIALLFFLKPQKESKVVVQFASWGSESEINILKPILKNFEKENPDIKIDFMHIPQNYFQKIHLLFASNTAPDVIFINNQYLPIYANYNLLENLSDKDIEFDKFYKKSLDSLSWGGNIYSIPRDISNIVIYYNKDLFRKYHINYPKDNWDYNDFLETTKKLTHHPNIFGVSFDENPLFYIPYMTSCGGWEASDTENFFNKDFLKNENNLKGLNFYADLRQKYHVAPYKNEIASATSAQMFLQGKLGMQISGRWLVPKYRQEAIFDWDIAKFPSCNENSKSIVPLDSSGWAISKTSKHKKEAVKLIKYLSSYKSIAEFTKSGLIVPARIDVANSEIFMDNQKPKNSKIFLSIIETSEPTPVTPDYNEILDNLKSKNEYLFNR